MVSIIVPVYNIKEYLPHCVASLLGQTASDLQIVLVDDGSTDGSGELCDRYAAADPRVCVVHKQNGGLSDARNAGLDAAMGEWLLFIDGDDYLVPNAVELLLKAAAPDVDFVQFHYHETEDIHWQPETDQEAAAQVCTDNALMWQRLYELGGVAASSCTKLWNRRVFEEARFQKGILHEDEELLNRLLPKCRKVVYTALELYGYVTRVGSIVRSGFKPKSMDIFPIMEKRIAVLEGLGQKALVLETKKRMFRTAVWQYCLARSGGCKTKAVTLKQRAASLAKEPLALEGQYALLHKAVKAAPVALNLYYLIRRVCGKI